MPTTAATSSDLTLAAARTSRALIRNHPADVALNARHVDLYDRPLTRAGSGMAHKARGTSAPITDEGVARFLAATAVRETDVDAALARHSAVRATSRHLPIAERKAVRRASSAASMAAIDEAHVAFRAALV